MSPSVLRNPVLRGFHPDPSILRVGEDFYVANSTFEWFPGVRLHHSRDLRHWRTLPAPLDRLSLLDLRGDKESGGIWAPCLSHDGERFHLVYTDVKASEAGFMDCHNWLVTAPAIEGPWSEPVYLNSSGFDPSLFHDADGRKWLLNMIWDPRDHGGGFFDRFGGIVLQEYAPSEKRLVGPVRVVFRGTALGVTEGPHVFRRGGWYYLLLAEGGTSYDHAATMCRARRLEGPWEEDPGNPILTAKGTGARLQRAGHASLVELPDGSWWMAHLCGRPFVDEAGGRWCVRGRETALQRCVWTEAGWLRLEGGGSAPRDAVAAPDLPLHPFEAPADAERFDGPTLPLEFQTLRVAPEESWLSLRERPGWLRLTGRESSTSRHRQSLVARRVRTLACEAETRIDFEPGHFLQSAGLAAYYGTHAHYLLAVTHHERLGRCVKTIAVDREGMHEPAGEGLAVPAEGLLRLKAVLETPALRFFAAPGEGGEWRQIGPALDATKLSDEYAGGHTGAFIGLFAQDMLNGARRAYFDGLRWRETETG